MVTGYAAITGSGAAFPAAISQDRLWQGFFDQHFQGVQRALAKRLFGNAGVQTRHPSVSPLVEDVSGWTTGQRMRRYLVEAMPLGKAALDEALARAGTPASEVGLLVVCSCTGYATPGLDIMLARDLGLPADVQRLFVGHMGCYAALPGLSTAANYVRVHRRPAALLCVELPSLHLQPPTADPEQIVAHALFSDAAAAVVLEPDGAGHQVCDTVCVTDPTVASYMTWDVTDLGFRMGLSAQVPEVLDRYVGQLVADLLHRHGLAVADVDGWAVHPGGPRILDVVRDRLGLTESALTASRQTLAEHGNCSSPTVLAIVDQLRDAGADTIVALAFGPGLTLYGALLAAT